MSLFLDGDSTVTRERCPECANDHVRVTSFVLDEIGPHAIAYSALHHHDGPVAWIDLVFGDFDDPATDERHTFGCRVGPVPGHPDPAATAVDAGAAYPETATFGHKLTRAEALAHPDVEEMWRVLDFLLEAEDAVRRHVYGPDPDPAPRARWWRRT